MADNALPIILITRPWAAAVRFADACRKAFGGGVAITLAPLMEIVPVPFALDLCGVQGLIFTSAAGVGCYATATGRRDVPAWCVGDQTAATARSIGLVAHSAHGMAKDLFLLFLPISSPWCKVKKAQAFLSSPSFFPLFLFSLLFFLVRVRPS